MGGRLLYVPGGFRRGFKLAREAKGTARDGTVRPRVFITRRVVRSFPGDGGGGGLTDGRTDPIPEPGLAQVQNRSGPGLSSMLIWMSADPSPHPYTLRSTACPGYRKLHHSPLTVTIQDVEVSSYQKVSLLFHSFPSKCDEAL